MKNLIMVFLLLKGIIGFTHTCQGKQVTACSNYKSNCGSYYMGGGDPKTKTTYCWDCDYCSAGAPDCVKETKGCKKCEASTNTYSGVQCSASGSDGDGRCTNGGQSCSFKG